MGERVGQAVEGRCIRACTTFVFGGEKQPTAGVDRTMPSPSRPSIICLLRREEGSRCRCELVASIAGRRRTERHC